MITAGGSGEQILGNDGFDVRAFCHIGASADGASVEGDALDHGVDFLAVGELQGCDRLAGEPGDQRVPAAIEAKLCDWPLGRANLGNDTGQDIQSA